MIEEEGDYRIERRFVAASDGRYRWVLYQRLATGVERAPDSSILEPGRHPCIGGETIEDFAWLPIFAGTEEAARKRMRELLADDAW